MFSSFRSLAAVVLLPILLFYALPYFDSQALESYIERHPFFGPLMFILVYGATPFSLLPTLPLNILSGYIFGSLLGTFYSCCGATLGSSIFFFLFRSGRANAWVRKWIRYEEKQWDTRINKKVLFLLRLNPLIPTPLMGAISGLSSLSYRNFVFISLLGGIPATYCVSLLGNTARQQTGHLIAISTAALLFLALVFASRRKSSR